LRLLPIGGEVGRAVGGVVGGTVGGGVGWGRGSQFKTIGTHSRNVQN